MADHTTKAELQAELDEANDRIEELEAKLEDIVSIADDAEEDNGADNSPGAGDDHDDRD